MALTWGRRCLYLYRFLSAGSEREKLWLVHLHSGGERCFILEILKRKCVSWRTGLAEPRAARRARTIRAKRSLERDQRLPPSSFYWFIPRRLVFPPIPALIARCWNKPEFSSRQINTMWPCRDSNYCPIWEYLIDPGLENGQTSVKAW